MYANPAANSYPSIFIVLYLMIVALPGSSGDTLIYINTSNKFATIDLVKDITTSYTEVAEVQGITMTYL